MHGATASFRVLRLFVVLSALAIAASAEAVPIVTSTVTFAGGLYEYDYTITSDVPLPEELLIITIPVPTNDAAIDASKSAPAGFKASYDAGLGLVDFLADSLAFVPGVPISGFVFSSAVGPGPTTFEAFLSDGSVQSGRTTGPTGAAPEPVSALLLALGAVATGVRMRRQH